MSLSTSSRRATGRSHLRLPRLLVVLAAVLAVLAADMGGVQPSVASAAPAARAAKNLPPLPSDAPVRVKPEVPAGDFRNPPDPTRPSSPPAPKSSFDPDRSTPVDEETTPTRRVYLNSDRSKTAMVDAAPSRYQEPSGAWKEIDLNVIAGPDNTLVARTAPDAARLSSRADGTVATVDTDAGPITARHPDAAAVAAIVSAEKATYANALPGGRELEIALTTDGFEETVVLASPGAPASYRVEFSLPLGVSAAQGPSGVEFVAGDTVVASFGGGVAYDATLATAGPSASTDVAVRLVSEALAVATVEVSVDQAWLGDKGRVFPARIDPTFSTADPIRVIDAFADAQRRGVSSAADQLPAGPYRTLPLGGDSAVPWYMLPYDQRGRCEAPATRAALETDLAAGGYSDVYVFCHGWNNSWKDAVHTYDRFIAGYAGLRGERGLALDRPERPLLIGVYWPGAILVLPGEEGPSLVGDRDPSGELELLPPPTTAEVLQLWGAGPSGTDFFGEGLLVKVRDVLRQATVWLMKDRAGRVGVDGVGPLLTDVLAAAAPARVHLIGHSFGCQALLSGMCAQSLPRPLSSVLLLQPAVNLLCFASDVTGQGQPGGFRPALALVEQPILSTFSHRDESLTRYWHLALRRSSDLGEMGLVGGAPSRYAALGGYGPGGCGTECEGISMADVGDPYPLGSGPVRLLGVDGSAAISHHGDVSSPATWWALWCQVSAG